jgi:hypothetical protein
MFLELDFEKVKAKQHGEPRCFALMVLPFGKILFSSGLALHKRAGF